MPYKLVSKILDSQTFSRAETIFQGNNFAFIYHGWNYFLRVLLTTFSRLAKRFDGWKSQGEFFFTAKMVPSIYVRSSLNLGRVSLIFTISSVYCMINITQKTLLDGVCVSSVMCPISNIGSGKCVCVCPISLCPIYKIEGGDKKLVFFLCVWCPISFFFGCPI